MNLRDYQIEITNNAIDKLHKYKLVYLSMQVRTGKTITALNICNELRLFNVLFVTKKKAISSIQKDATNFSSLNVNCVNYESLHKVTQPFDIVIIDEAHSLGKFPKPSQRTLELIKIIKGQYIIFLSGTPSPESFSQLYHQFFITENSPFAKYSDFYKWAKDFVIVKKKFIYNREMNDYSNAIESEIDKHTKHLFINFTQKEAGFENRITEKILYVEMDAKIKKCIDILLRDKILEGKTGTVTADTAVKLQNKIHQLCSGTVKDDANVIHIISKSKALLIKEYFADKRIVIFYKFIGEMEVLKEVFSDEWTNVPENFQSGLKRVYLGQFVSSREGIRLDEADCIIFYNIDFSFLSYEQARNRITSKERTKEAVLYWIFTIGGIEEKIYKVVVNKKSYTNYYFKKDYGIKNTSKN